jgi:hypothetical protein
VTASAAKVRTLDVQAKAIRLVREDAVDIHDVTSNLANLAGAVADLAREFEQLQVDIKKIKQRLGIR